MYPRTPSRRDVLRGAGAGVVGLATGTTRAAAQAQPDPDEYEEILEAMDGTGMPDDPYVVTGLREFRAIEGARSHWFSLESDIDAGPAQHWNDGRGWEPIPAFNGTLHGNGHELTNLEIQTGDEAGLFDFVSAYVYDLHVSGNVRGGNTVGILAGTLGPSRLTGVSVSGRVEGHEYVGGIAGIRERVSDELDRPELERCTADCRVDGRRAVGGLCGAFLGRSIKASAAVGSVRGNEAVGGLVGVAESRAESRGIERCVSTASVTARRAEPTKIGGLVGESRASIRSCRATGPVHARNADDVGGLVGKQGHDDFADDEFEIVSSYAAGQVRGRRQTGGLVGSLEGSAVSESYATSDVVGDQVAGLVASPWGPLSDVYATGSVRGCSSAGGLIGGTHEPVTRTFATSTPVDEHSAGGLALSDTEGIEDSYWIIAPGDEPRESANGVTERSRDDVQGSAAERNLNGFDFESVWRTRYDSLPALRTFDADHLVELTESPETATAGEPLQVTVAVENDGTDAARDPLQLYVGDTLVATEYLGELDPGERRETTIIVPSVPHPTGDVAVVARVGYDEVSAAVTIDDGGDGGQTSRELGDPCRFEEFEEERYDEPRVPHTEDRTPGPGIVGGLMAVGGTAALLLRRVRRSAPDR